jgi:hypothetical protein
VSGLFRSIVKTLHEAHSQALNVALWFVHAARRCHYEVFVTWSKYAFKRVVQVAELCPLSVASWEWPPGHRCDSQIRLTKPSSLDIIVREQFAGRVGVWRHIDAIEGVRHEADCDTTVPAGKRCGESRTVQDDGCNAARCDLCGRV